MKETSNMDRDRLRFVILLIALLALPLVEAARAQGQAWPDESESQDVGDVGAAGSSELVGTRLIVRGSGADVWHTADEFHFAHTRISGDFELTAYVAHVEDVDRWTKAGLMIRDGLAANARHAFLFATPRTERGVAFQRRPFTGGASVHTSGPATAPPVWLRLTRRGGFVAAAVRAVETDEWTPIGEQHFSGLPREVNVGFAVSSHVDGYAAEAWFDQITVESLNAPAGWQSSDVGDVGAAGDTVYDGQTGWPLAVSGAGADVWGTSDAFHFAWLGVVGNFDFKAWVHSVEQVNVWTKAGLMMRESLAPGARHAFVLATPTTEKGLAFQRRLSTGGTSVHTSGPSLAPGVWLRLVRTGDVITTYYRHPTATEDFWMPLGSQTFASLPSMMLVGFAVSSHERGRLAEAQFHNVELTLGSSEWQAHDIGDVGAAGHSSVDEQSGPEFTVHGSGADVWGTADEFHFLSREAVGNFDFSARVVVEDVDKWTKAGLMMREGLSAHARHAFVIQTPRTERGVAFQRRPVAGGSSLHTAGPATAPPGFLRLVREGDVVWAYHKAEPADSWMLIGTQTFTSLSATVRIGFAVSSHVDGTLATGYFDNLTLVHRSMR
jgi:regulation of enolase protein 1 (concanavalin A-like superfamily)